MSHVLPIRAAAPADRWAPLAVFAVALGFYIWTLSPSVGWADATRLQLDAALGGSTYWFLEDVDRTAGDGRPFQFLGVAAWDHPLYVLLAQIFVALPGANLAWRINLLSAVTAALAVACLFVVGFWLVGDRRAAALAAAALAVSHTFWFQGVTAEVYALHAAFMVAFIGFVLFRAATASPRVRWIMAVVVGLAMANHGLFALTFATAVITAPRGALKRPGIGHAFALLGGFLLGFAPWWIQFLRMWKATGLMSTVQAVTGSPAFFQRLWIDSVAMGLGNLASYAGFLVYQFTPFGVAVGVWGFVHLRRQFPAAFRLLLALFVVHALFSANYQVPDRYTFHVFSYGIFALPMAVGFGQLLAVVEARWRSRPVRLAVAAIAIVLLVVSPVAIYAVTPRALRAAGVEEAAVGIPPIGTGARDGLDYFLNPNRRGEDSAGRFAHRVLNALPPGALVLTPKENDQETYLVLRYFQLVEHLRPDVEMDMLLLTPTRSVAAAILDRVRAQASCRAVYFASLNPRWYPLEAMSNAFTIVEEAGLYRVRASTDALPHPCETGPDTRRHIDVPTLMQEAMRKR